VTFCGGINSAKGRKGGKGCCKGRIVVHRNAIESIASHKGADNGTSTMKGDGNGAT
jgi:hypothetical protein